MVAAGLRRDYPRPLPRGRGQIAYETGIRIVGMVWEDLKPVRHPDAKRHSKTAIVVNSAIGGSTNCPDPHQRAGPPYRRGTRHRRLAENSATRFRYW